jgi:hypothetical protein
MKGEITRYRRLNIQFFSVGPADWCFGYFSEVYVVSAPVTVFVRVD